MLEYSCAIAHHYTISHYTVDHYTTTQSATIPLTTIGEDWVTHAGRVKGRGGWENKEKEGEAHGRRLGHMDWRGILNRSTHVDWRG